MRRAAGYPRPVYVDPKDLRFVQIVKPALKSSSRAVNIVGVPFDGAVLGRKGAADGPSAIREATRFFSSYDTESETDLTGARVFDIGDVVVAPDDVEKTQRAVEKEVSAALDSASLLVMLGGDNSISLPSIRATAKKFGKIGLIIFDSHFDMRGMIHGQPTSGSSYGLALAQLRGRLDGSRVVHIGSHGFLNSRKYAKEAERTGMTIFTASDVREKGAQTVARQAYKVCSEGVDAVYLSVDLDCLDLAHVSGVSAPSVGGMDVLELLQGIRQVASMKKVVCSDLVELAPRLDPSGKSQVVAATALVYIIAGFVDRR
jgi:formiminoglutamase